MLQGLEYWLINLGVAGNVVPWLAQGILLTGILLVGYIWVWKKGALEWE